MSGSTIVSESKISNASTVVPSIVDPKLLVGSLPDYELKISPRWLFFTEKDGYKRAQFATFTLLNRDKARVGYRFKTKDRNLVMFTPGHGFLDANETCEITEHEGWLNDPASYVGAVHKVIVENVILHPELELPQEANKKKALCRSIFKATRDALTLQQGAVSVYTKMKIVLPNYDFASTDC